MRRFRSLRGGNFSPHYNLENDPIQTRPTESESDGDEEEGNDGSHQEESESRSFQSDDSVPYGIPIPNSYLLTSATTSSSAAAGSNRPPPSSSNNNNNNNTNNKNTAKRKGASCLPTSPAEQRLVMMAKHPGMSVSSEEAISPSIHDYEQPSTAPTPTPRSSNRNKNNTSVNFDIAGPIDADTGNAWVANDNSEMVIPWEAPCESASSSSSNPTAGTSRWDRLVAWFYYRPLDAQQEGGGADIQSQDGVASKQSMSVVSDQTPRVSNVSLQKKRKLAAAAKLAAANDGMDSSSTSDHQSWCRRIISTRSGIVILCLVVVLFLAIIVTVSAAVASSNKNGKSTGNALVGDNPRIVPGPMVPTRPATTPIPTTAPTLIPTTAPTIDLGSLITTFPSVSPTTASPTTNSPSPAPTPSPTSRPTLPGATNPPTPPPTPRPTRLPTPLPTPRPTPRPTPLPTLLPTPLPTTRPPTSSPTTQFDGILLQPLEALLGQGQQRFGYSIALSQDGTILAVGAPWATLDGKFTAGMVQVYQLSRSRGWLPRGPAVVGRNAGDQFGSSVSLSSDGSVLAVGAPTYTGVGNRSGNVRVFVYGPGNRYDLLGNEIPGLAATDHFGVAVALSQDGRRLAVGAPYHNNGIGGSRLVSGRLGVYELDTAASQWNVIASFRGSNHLDWFGWSVDIANTDTSANGAGSSVVCAGAPRNLQYGGYVMCYTDRGGTWQPLGNALRNNVEPVRYDDSWGNALSLSQDGNRVAIGSPGKNGASGVLNTGMVAVYDYDVASNNWKLLGPALTLQNAPSNQDSFLFGSSLDLVGSVLAVGSPGLGQVDLYEYQAGQWQRHSQSWKSSDNNNGATNSDYGYAVELTPTYTLAVASAATDGSQPGRVNVYKP
jgi:hypothetical protein